VAAVNGAPGLRVLVDGAVDLVATLRIEGGQVTGLYLVRNPRKLGRVDEAVRLRR
jgi:RNA polymerase sigma-70 factor (ECF subfamily)